VTRLSATVACLLSLLAAVPAPAAEWPYVRASEILRPPPLEDAAPAIPASSEKTFSVTPSVLRGSILASIDDAPTGSIGGTRWPGLSAAQKPATFDKRVSSQFRFEGGARYWYSTGGTSFAFKNGSPIAGNPTSTIDWSGTTGHSAEVFARIDHLPSQIFVKGLFGGGRIGGGHMDDRDFFVGQIKLSDTTSEINGDSMRYAILDVGYKGYESDVVPIVPQAIGVDLIPEAIRNSKVLTGNDLGRLGNVEHLPDEAAVQSVTLDSQVQLALKASYNLRSDRQNASCTLAMYLIFYNLT